MSTRITYIMSLQYILVICTIVINRSSTNKESSVDLDVSTRGIRFAIFVYLRIFVKITYADGAW